MRRNVRHHFAALLGLIGAFATLLSLLTVPAASAAPTGSDTTLPAELQKYAPNSAAWANSPWMTSPTCAGRGGDFSLWTASVIADTPLLLKHYQPRRFGPLDSASDRGRSDAILEGYRKLNDTIKAAIPSGYCVSDIAAWAAGSPAQAPFGFTWGSGESGSHQSMYSCAPEHPAITGDEALVGADRAMCDGFFLDCDRVSASDAQQRCATWNSFSDEYVRQVNELRHTAISAHPAAVERAAVDTVIAPIGGLIWWGWAGLVVAVVALFAIVLWIGITSRSRRGR